MSSRRATATGLAVMLAAALSGCVTERAVELVIEPPRDAMGGPAIPAEVVAWEVRVVRLGDDDLCPSADASAEARPFGELADAQSFAAGGASMAIGELPAGRWGFAAMARDEACRPLLYGCVATELAPDARTIVVPVEPVTSSAACGCRACDAGACVEVERVCGD